LICYSVKGKSPVKRELATKNKENTARDAAKKVPDSQKEKKGKEAAVKSAAKIRDTQEGIKGTG